MSNNDLMKKQPEAIEPLALNTREAAKALRLGERTLWSLTKDGCIPHVRLGRCLIYPVDQLRDWLASRATGGESPETDNCIDIDD